MPQTKVIFYQDTDGTSPVVTWLETLRKENKKAWANCRVRIEQLTQMGRELRRPASDFLRDGIYELRAKEGHVQYRLLYFFHGRNVAIVAHGLTKEDKVLSSDIERALKRKKLYESNPKEHTYEEHES
jgi:phage-related protein